MNSVCVACRAFHTEFRCSQSPSVSDEVQRMGQLAIGLAAEGERSREVKVGEMKVGGRVGGNSPRIACHYCSVEVGNQVNLPDIGQLVVEDNGSSTGSWGCKYMSDIECRSR